MVRNKNDALDLFMHFQPMKIFIASFGSRIWIHKKMTESTIHCPVTDIYTPGRFDGYEDGDPMDNKNEMIHKAREEYGCSRPLLVDDSRANIDALEEWMDGYWVSGKNGITKEDAATILRNIDEHAYDAIFLDADMTLFRDHVTSKYFYDWIDLGKDLEEFDVSVITMAEGSNDLFQGLIKKTRFIPVSLVGCPLEFSVADHWVYTEYTEYTEYTAPT
jgi:hypothetical protein